MSALPAAKQTFAEAVSPAPAPVARPNILIVDDRKENLLATERVLRSLDAGIFKATSGNEALSLMLRHRFALVLLDVQMPEMNGFETAKLMQEHESMRRIPIIFVTAISKEEQYATQAAEIGAVDYIFKPINSDILRSKVRVYLDLYVQHEQILALNEHLRQSNEELERFAYICSHDMQEPVRMMNSYAGLLQEKYHGQLDEKAQKYLTFIAANARHMQKMILDILTFSRVGRETPQMETLDCNRVFQDVLSEFESVIADKKARILCDPLPTLEGCPTLMRVLFQNLLGNALKFQDGSKTPEIAIQAAQTDGEWLFTVRDNGIGIDPAFNDRVFAIFQRIHRKEDYPGTGIGLSTCKKFIELCGGRIWFESAPGQGAAFFFTVAQHKGGAQ
ncbi:MAG: response regulator [Alphaproteobacteria bacterium]|nr:response regulator [Alphaproteobacteria bacterium]